MSLLTAVKHYIKSLLGYKTYHFPRQGKNCSIGEHCIISKTEQIEMGDNVSIGPYAVLYAIYRKIIFGNNILLGPHVTIVNGDHSIRKVGVTIFQNQEKLPQDDADVIIEDDVWIGANVTILKGVTIGRGCVIAAGAVVTKDIPPYVVAGGVPAQTLTHRFTIAQIKEHEAQLYPLSNHLPSSALSHLPLQ